MFVIKKLNGMFLMDYDQTVHGPTCFYWCPAKRPDIAKKFQNKKEAAKLVRQLKRDGEFAEVCFTDSACV